MCAGNQQEVSWLRQWMYRTCVCLWAQQSGSMRKATVFVASSPRDIHSGKPVRDHIFDAAQVTHTVSSKWPQGGGASMNLCEALSWWWMLVISRKQEPSTQGTESSKFPCHTVVTAVTAHIQSRSRHQFWCLFWFASQVHKWHHLFGHHCNDVRVWHPCSDPSNSCNVNLMALQSLAVIISESWMSAIRPIFVVRTIAMAKQSHLKQQDSRLVCLKE